MTLNNLKHEADNIRLTSAEKFAMRAQLFGAPKGQSLESPELRTVLGRRSPYVFMSYHLRMSLAGLLLFVLAGTGTVSAAAASALPGDLLYPVKINVNEAVKVALAPSVASRAQVHAELADTRVEEAQALAARGSLDATATKELEDNFDRHAKSAQELALSIAVSDPAASVQITTELDSALAMNGSVLQALGRESSNKETKSNSGRLSSRVLGHVGAPGRIARADAASMPKAAEARTATFLASDDGATTSSIELANAPREREEDRPRQKLEDNGAAALEAKVAEVLAAARAQFAQASSTLDATTTAQLTGQFVVVDTLMSEGSASLEAGNGEAALADFTEALSKAARLRTVLKAQVKFDKGILKSLLYTSEQSR